MLTGICERRSDAATVVRRRHLQVCTVKEAMMIKQTPVIYVYLIQYKYQTVRQFHMHTAQTQTNEEYNSGHGQ